MSKQKIIIVGDVPTFSDYRLGQFEKNPPCWGTRPFYLLNKVILNDNFHVFLKNYEEGDLKNWLDRNVTKGAIIFSHIDRTFVPPNMEEILSIYEKYVKVFNHHIRDNSKRRVERLFEEISGKNLALKEGNSYEGEAVIKPNHNAGDPNGKKGYKFVGDIDPKIYPEEDWIVQRFIASSLEQEKPFHHLNRYILFKGEVFFCELYSLDKKIKQKTSISNYYRRLSDLFLDFGEQKAICLNDLGANYRNLTKRELEQVDLVLTFAKRCKLDFGSIDLISSESGDYIIDVNKTPWERGFPEFFLEIIRRSLLMGG